MTRDKSRLTGTVAILLGAAVLGPGAGPARAQWGMGWGWGGFGGFNYTSSPTNFLQQHALQNAARAGAPSSNRPYAGSPNAYFNNIRDNGFVPQFDVQRRRPTTERVARSPAAGRASTSAEAPPAAAARPRPVLPLASFFDASWKLVWPAEAPTDGELRQKRDVSDEASLAVLSETKRQGLASLSTVTDARQKLLDYGRPALRDVRAANTPRVADTFHLFLLSLYESLAQAATPADDAVPPIP